MKSKSTSVRKPLSAANFKQTGKERKSVKKKSGRGSNFNDSLVCLGEFPGSEYNQEEIEFLKAIDVYKAKNNRRFPQYTEILAIVYSLGYRRIAEPVTLPKFPIKIIDRVHC